MKVDRRKFLQGTAAIAAAGMFSSSAWAQEAINVARKTLKLAANAHAIWVVPTDKIISTHGDLIWRYTDQSYRLARGYGREVQIAHGGGLISLYGHMSEIVAQPGSFVRRGQLIGYVGSSGLSTGPHLHFEVRQGGTPVNPLAVHFSSVQVADTGLVNAVKARLKTLLGVGLKRG